MPRRPDAVITPNPTLREARERTPSPWRAGQAMSRTELADAVNAALDQLYPGRDLTAHYVDSRWIGKLERGEHRWPSDERRAALRHALGAATDTELGLYIPRHTDATGPGLSVHESRRNLLLSIAAVATAAGLLGGVAGRRRRLGSTDVERLAAVLTLYRSMDYELGGGALTQDLTHFATATLGLLEHSCSEPVQARLSATVASVHQLAGWAAFDSGQHRIAHELFGTAQRLASGDVLLTARIQYCVARQAQHLRDNRLALDTLSRALEYLPRDATPGVTAMLLGAQAASQAALGDGRTALNTLDRASQAFGNRDETREPDWLRFYDRGELLAQYGRVYRDLARLDRRHGSDAVDRSREAIAALGAHNVRSTVLNETGLASALFLAGDPDQAVAAGRRVLEHAGNLVSHRVNDRIANLRRDIDGYEKHPAVAAFIRDLPGPAGTRS